MWPNPQFPADFFTFTEEILREKLDFLCSVNSDALITVSVEAFLDYYV